jgi:hypothetical protein
MRCQGLRDRLKGTPGPIGAVAAVRARNPSRRPKPCVVPMRQPRIQGNGGRSQRWCRTVWQRREPRNGDKWSDRRGPCGASQKTPRAERRGTGTPWRLLPVHSNSFHRVTGRSAPRRSAHPRAFRESAEWKWDYRRTRRLPKIRAAQRWLLFTLPCRGRVARRSEAQARRGGAVPQVPISRKEGPPPGLAALAHPPPAGAGEDRRVCVDEVTPAAG